MTSSVQDKVCTIGLSFESYLKSVSFSVFLILTTLCVCVCGFFFYFFHRLLLKNCARIRRKIVQLGLPQETVGKQLNRRIRFTWVRGFLCGTSALRAVDDVMVSKLRLTDTKYLDLYGCFTFKNLHFLCWLDN